MTESQVPSPESVTLSTEDSVPSAQGCAFRLVDYMRAVRPLMCKVHGAEFPDPLLPERCLTALTTTAQTGDITGD